MVNGSRTYMVNEWLISAAGAVPSAARFSRPRAGRHHTQPLSSRIASCQIISIPASLSLRHGIATKFLPP